MHNPFPEMKDSKVKAIHVISETQENEKRLEEESLQGTSRLTDVKII